MFSIHYSNFLTFNDTSILVFPLLNNKQSNAPLKGTIEKKVSSLSVCHLNFNNGQNIEQDSC